MGYTILKVILFVSCLYLKLSVSLILRFVHSFVRSLFDSILIKYLYLFPIYLQPLRPVGVDFSRFVLLWNKLSLFLILFFVFLFTLCSGGRNRQSIMIEVRPVASSLLLPPPPQIYVLTSRSDSRHQNKGNKLF